MCSEQSATAEFTTDDEILAALRPKEVRTDRPEFTTDDELLAALNRNEDALNSARATLDREKQEQEVVDQYRKIEEQMLLAEESEYL